MNKFRDKDVLSPHPHPAPPLSYYSLAMVLMNCCDYRNRIALQDSLTGSSWTVLQVAHCAQDADPGDQPVCSTGQALCLEEGTSFPSYKGPMD